MCHTIFLQVYTCTCLYRCIHVSKPQELNYFNELNKATIKSHNYKILLICVHLYYNAF